MKLTVVSWNTLRAALKITPLKLYYWFQKEKCKWTGQIHPCCSHQQTGQLAKCQLYSALQRQPRSFYPYLEIALPKFEYLSWSLSRRHKLT